MWPVFAALVIVEGVLFGALPFSGDGPDGFVAALLLATGLNLVVVALLAPLGGLVLRRRRADLPRPIANDVAGTALLVALLVSLVVAGLVNRSAVQRDERDLAHSLAAGARFLADRDVDALRLEPGVYRVCASGEEPSCVYVNTDQSPPGITRDPAHIPNAQLAPRF